ncbi:MAG: hypothetical protein JXL97_18785 [Bacteroidales bacterium]|nr:hypothetical protein [Bacteroidales bacterium]
MEKDIKNINKIFLEGDENIVIQDIENSTITINKNNPEELKAFFGSFGDKIMNLEDIISGNKKEFAQLKAILIEQYSKIKKAVMVVGTGAFNLPKNVYKSSVQIGKLLAEMNFELFVGGWEGVDYVVAEEFSKIINKTDFKLSDKLTQIVYRGKEPVFKGGQITYVEQGVMEWVEGLKTAKALILIGGQGGTYETFLYAKQEKVAVLPIAFPGGDAERIFNEISTDIDNYKYLKDCKNDFLKLENESFIDGLKNILNKIFQ